MQNPGKAFTIELSGDRKENEAGPAKQKQQTPEGGHRTEYSDSRQRQHVKASRKQNNADEKGPSSQHEKPRGPDVSDRSSNDQQGKCVIHLITHAGFKDREHFRRKPCPQRMSTEGAKGDAQKTQN